MSPVWTRFKITQTVFSRSPRPAETSLKMIFGPTSDLGKHAFGLKVDHFQDRWANLGNALTCGNRNLGDLGLLGFGLPTVRLGDLGLGLGRPLTCDGLIWAEFGLDLAKIQWIPRGPPLSEARGTGTQGWVGLFLRVRDLLPKINNHKEPRS